MKTRPLTRIHDHSAMVTVLETGHVGLTTGVTLAFLGRQVAGVDGYPIQIGRMRNRTTSG